MGTEDKVQISVELETDEADQDLEDIDREVDRVRKQTRNSADKRREDIVRDKVEGQDVRDRAGDKRRIGERIKSAVMGAAITQAASGAFRQVSGFTRSLEEVRQELEKDISLAAILQGTSQGALPLGPAIKLATTISANIGSVQTATERVKQLEIGALVAGAGVNASRVAKNFGMIREIEAAKDIFRRDMESTMRVRLGASVIPAIASIYKGVQTVGQKFKKAVKKQTQ